MIRFNNDYNHGTHASILEALEEINETSYAGYGEDEWCQRGADEIRKYLGNVDGASLGYWLSCDECDVTLEDLTNIADVFYIGGTKCGALFGEALVIVNKKLRDHFRTYMKQSSGILAKGWLLGLQFYTLFKNGLYFELTKHADELAMKLKQGFHNASIPFYMDSPTNQQFVILTNKLAEKLSKEFTYEFDHVVDDEHICVRFCTSWSTSEDDVDKLLEFLS